MPSCIQTPNVRRLVAKIAEVAKKKISRREVAQRSQALWGCVLANSVDSDEMPHSVAFYWSSLFAKVPV